MRVRAQTRPCACEHVALLIQHATCMRHIVWRLHIFRHYLINGTIFEKKKLPNIKCVFSFSLQLLFETLLILRILRDIVINVKTPLSKVPVIFLGF
jgi:hypothetical protein